MGRGIPTRVGCVCSAREDPWALAGYEAPGEGEFMIGVLGDLHLQEPMGCFEEGRRHMAAALAGGAAGNNGLLVQLGDLGGPKGDPGSAACFAGAKEYLSGFGVPFSIVLGNHDLESLDFVSDEENLAAWQDVFGAHHWVREHGPAVLVGMSTTRFRSNPNSHHEVYIDDAQVAWLEHEVLPKYKDRPVFVFTHAPPAGCGLRLLQEVHVKNTCAWLNHSSRPEVFLRLCRANPQIKLWFSAHFHLSHDHEDSVSVVEGTPCHFVQVNVMGTSNRDASRQSRVLRYTRDRFDLYTVSHSEEGAICKDIQSKMSDTSFARGITCRAQPFEKLGSSKWFLAAFPENEDSCCSLFGDELPTRENSFTWYHLGGTVLGLNNNMLVEYDSETQAPLGVVSKDVGERFVRIVEAADASEGVDVIELVPYGEGCELERVPRRPDGHFMRQFQQNKWVTKDLFSVARERQAQLAGGGQ